jgi:hypothetical protein
MSFYKWFLVLIDVWNNLLNISLLFLELFLRVIFSGKFI